MSMKPGATTMPRASMVRLAGSACQIADGGDPARRMPMSPEYQGEPGAVDDPAVADDHVIRAGGKQKKRK